MSWSIVRLSSILPKATRSLTLGNRRAKRAAGAIDGVVRFHPGQTRRFCQLPRQRQQLLGAALGASFGHGYLHLLQIDDLATFANLEINGSLPKLLADATKQRACFAQALRRQDNLQAVARFFVRLTIVCHPGVLEGTFQRIATEGIANQGQDGPSLSSADFRAVVPMGGNTGDDEHYLFSAPEGGNRLGHND